MNLFKVFFFFLFFVVFGLANGLGRIVIPGATPSHTPDSALLKLKSLLLDNRYKSCKDDLQNFMSSLSVDD